MRTPRTRLATTIAERITAGVASEPLAQGVAAYLLSERCVGELDSLLRDVQVARADGGYVEVLAHSAHPLTVEVRADITKRIGDIMSAAKQVVVTEVLDPEVIGGVRLNLANRQLDLSVASKLNKFKQLTRV